MKSEIAAERDNSVERSQLDSHVGANNESSQQEDSSNQLSAEVQNNNSISNIQE